MVQHGHPDEGLTIGETAARLGVTVRTLHHWDRIGLAGPSQRTPGGYRLYTATDLIRLRRVMIYREVGVPLAKIADLLDEATADPALEIRRQINQVAAKIEQLRTAELGLTRLLEAHERGILLTPEQQVETFGDGWKPEWVAQAKNRWGGNAQWVEYAEKSAQRTPKEWAANAETMTRLETDFVDTFRRGVHPDDAEAHDLAERHREVFEAYFALTYDMQVILGRGYEQQLEYREHYDRLAPGLASWLRQAFESNAAAHGVDLSNVTWG